MTDSGEKPRRGAGSLDDGRLRLEARVELASRYRALAAILVLEARLSRLSNLLRVRLAYIPSATE